MIELHAKQLFLESLWDYYASHARHDLPWRQPESDGSYDPYKIMVSELMLQQTQVSRVIPKYHEFLARYPTYTDLAAASLGDVLVSWQGLGYNRRAKFIWQAAKMLSELGYVPRTISDLTILPGIGKNTAGAIMAYAHNMPVVFVETNIRTVYIQHFASDQTDVPDSFISHMLEETLDTERPREFYWALMDYGSYLKPLVKNNTQSKHFVKQSPFKDSRRQIRGQIIRTLQGGDQTFDSLSSLIPDVRLDDVLEELVGEQLIQHRADKYSLH